jgi:RNA polymerase sigma factor (sigma-70 family)
MADPLLGTTTILLRKACEGDRAAREDLYRLLLPRLRAIVHGRVPPRLRRLEETEDFIQDALQRALPRIAQFQAQTAADFLCYLHTIVLNLIRTHLGRERPPGPIPAEVPDEGAPSPLEKAVGREVAEAYDEALEKLRAENGEYYVAHLLRTELGLSHEQIAEALGKSSPDAARMTVTRARDRLAEMISHLFQAA